MFRSCVTVFIFFAALSAGILSGAETAPREKVRVGFFQFDGYHMSIMRPDGNVMRSGYGYDLLHLMQPYTNWNYEYIGYRKGWTEMLPMLERGDIDLLTSAVKIPEKEIKFDFSSRSIGFSSVIMTVKAGNCRFLPRDYSHWNGIQVGVLQGNSKNEVFAAFAKEKGFSYKEIAYNQVDDMYDALQHERIDAIVTGSLRRLRNEWLYEQLDVRPFYVIVKKGNSKLLNEINTALECLSIDHPGFSDELHKKYYDYRSSGGNGLSFSMEEQDFIQNCKAQKRQFKVLINPIRYPFSYFKNGKLQGIMSTLMQIIERRSKLEFEPVFCRDRAEYLKKLERQECDLVFDLRNDYSFAEQRGFILTPPYLTNVLSRVTLKSFSGKIKTCAVVGDNTSNDAPKMPLLENCRIITRPTEVEVIEAVKDGTADTCIVLGRTAENALRHDFHEALDIAPAGISVQYAIGVRENLDRRLVGILNKAARSLSESDVQQAVLADNLQLHSANPTLTEYMKRNPNLVIVSLLGLVVLMGSTLTVVLIYQRRARRLAATLAEKYRLWLNFMDALPVLAFIKDADNGYKYMQANRALGEFHHCEWKSLIGMTDEELFGENYSIVRDDDITCMRYNMKIDKVIRLKLKDGSLRYMHVTKVPFTTTDGKHQLIGLSLDVTELQKAKNLAEENAERFQKTLISIGDGVLTTDEAGRITLINPVAEKMLGANLTECKGKQHTDYFNIVSYLDGTPVPSPVKRCLNAGEIVTLANHTDLISRNGKRYHIADSAAPIRDPAGKITGAILVFRDVTREYDLRDQLQATAEQLREALTQAQQASAAKGVFLSQMSHEIRTPLNAIIGYLHIAMESDGDQEKIQECMEKGLDASTHLLSIINDILDISSIESGRLKIAHEDFDFKHLLTGIVSMYHAQAETRKIKFDMQLRDLTEERLVGDSLRVNQILLNLLSNAMKFTPAGGSVTLTVKQLAIVRDRVQLMLRVADTGCGMNDEYKKRLFTPFEQQDASTARKYGGTGLGLSITKNLVSMMNGTIEVESTENQGSTFTVCLPLDRSTLKKPVAEADFTKLRALIADDQDEDRVYMQMVLSKCGVKSDAVRSGEDAVEQMERRLGSRHPYDLCLLDLRLSGMNGIETAQKMRQLKGVTKDMPIILITAYDVSACSSDAQDAGVNKIIQKPLFQSTFFDFLMTSYYRLNEQRANRQVQDGLKGLRILLVEDNQMNMDISTQYLKRAGMEITQAWNGREAVDCFVKSAPGAFHAILMDIQMPVMDGYQATAAIRASGHADAKTIPIIAMTANAFNEDVVKALSVGMNDHISKPVLYDRLFTSISKLTQTREVK